MNGLSRLILGAIAAITLLAYFTSYYGWRIYLELLAHFQVQYLVLTLILLGILIFLRSKKHVYLGIFFCALLSVQTLVWYVPFNALFTSAQASDLRILVANINTQNKSYEKVLELARAEKPDVAVFIEVDRQWQSQLDTLKDLLPYSSGESNPYNLGWLIYSNKLLEKPEINFWGTEKNPSIITQITACQHSQTN